MTCFSIMSVLCHRETPWRLCVCVCADGIHRSPPFMPCELLMPFLSISHRYPTAFDKAAIIKPRFFLFIFFDSELHNLQIDKRRRSYFWEKHKSIKSPQIVRRTRIDRDSLFFLFLPHWGCAMWCIVRYINLPPTLCRSKQTLGLLFVVLPQQYFYLSCETAIQIDEVQQHDIFCTSITLRSRATWVKSQQTITFPDISSPHSDRWWILPDKAFIIAENRECTKICSLFFSPPSSAFPVQIEMNSAARSRMGLRAHR